MEAGSPLFENKHFRRAAVFQPENLMRETRRQKGLPEGTIPRHCVLDPDGDIVAHLLRRGEATRDPAWACYHTTMYRFERGGLAFGIIGCAVGGPFAVLLAEQMFVSGCELLISVTSAGRILPVREPPYFVLIDKALRDEGTSHHYLPAARYVELLPEVSARLAGAVKRCTPPVTRGAAWTTDAPYRETDLAIAAARAEGVLAVEMEAASLYAFAHARRKPVICFAHITNTMGVVAGDFEKGDDDGSDAALRVIETVALGWERHGRGELDDDERS
ncbi:nucleoside phosphorylase [Candidatus Binatia bacterium]|nr:nucleoside phosphorylase [Candidatus Binatia bacterium]